MGFSTKRGRPKLKVESEPKDLGTLELRQKRALGLTREQIDICHDKGIINADEYWAALHFRWLYTVRFGAPGVSAIEFEKQLGRDNYEADEEWQKLREMEYSMAVEKLRSYGALKTVMNLAIFNLKPKFLSKRTKISVVEVWNNSAELAKLREGLDVIAKLWGRK